MPIETIRRLSCDGSFVTVIEDADGTPLDTARKQRLISTPLRRALHAHDRGCTFPGCHRKHYLDAHHLRHWVDGGETTRENLTLLCTYHHRLLHEGGFRVKREMNGRLTFTRVDGRVIPRCGYRVEDFTDDDLDGVDDKNPSPEGFRGAGVQQPTWEVREPRAAYLVVANSAWRSSAALLAAAHT